MAVCTAGLHRAPLSSGCWLCTLLIPWEKEEGREVDPWAGRESLCTPLGPSVTTGPPVQEGTRALEHPIGHLCLIPQPQPMHAVLPDTCTTYSTNSLGNNQQRWINMAGLALLLLHSHKAALGWRPSPSRDWWHHEREGNNEKHQDLECPGANERTSFPLAAVHDSYSERHNSAMWHQCSWVYFPLKVSKHLLTTLKETSWLPEAPSIFLRLLRPQLAVCQPSYRAAAACKTWPGSSCDIPLPSSWSLLELPSSVVRLI